MSGIPENSIEAVNKTGLKDLHIYSNNIGLPDFGIEFLQGQAVLEYPATGVDTHQEKGGFVTKHKKGGNKAEIYSKPKIKNEFQGKKLYSKRIHNF